MPFLILRTVIVIFLVVSILLEETTRYLRHLENALFCRAVTSTLSQWLLHKTKNSRAVFIARIHAC